jgi:uncharacterized integral membrane protein
VTAHYEPEPLHEATSEVERPSVVTPKRVLAAVLVALVLTFLVQNGASARMHFLTLSFHLPIGVALLVSAVAGAVLALLATAARRRRVRRARRN